MSQQELNEMNLTADFARSVASDRQTDSLHQLNDYYEHADIGVDLWLAKKLSEQDGELSKSASYQQYIPQLQGMEDELDEDSLDSVLLDDLDDDLQIAGIVERFQNINLLLRNDNTGTFFSDAVHTIKSCLEEENKISANVEKSIQMAPPIQLEQVSFDKRSLLPNKRAKQLKL